MATLCWARRAGVTMTGRDSRVVKAANSSPPPVSEKDQRTTPDRADVQKGPPDRLWEQGGGPFAPNPAGERPHGSQGKHKVLSDGTVGGKRLREDFESHSRCRGNLLTSSGASHGVSIGEEKAVMTRHPPPLKHLELSDSGLGRGAESGTIPTERKLLSPPCTV